MSKALYPDLIPTQKSAEKTFIVGSFDEGALKFIQESILPYSGTLGPHGSFFEVKHEDREIQNCIRNRVIQILKSRGWYVEEAANGLNVYPLSKFKGRFDKRFYMLICFANLGLFTATCMISGHVTPGSLTMRLILLTLLMSLVNAFAVGKAARNSP
jgi:hypothetical protein